MFWSKPEYTISKRDMRAIDELTDALRDRLQGFDTEIEKLQRRCSALESELARMHFCRQPHVSLAQKLREKGKT